MPGKKRGDPSSVTMPQSQECKAVPAPLPRLTLEQWADRPPEERIDFLKRIDDYFHNLLDEIYKHGENSIEIIRESERRHANWRRSLMIATGLLAAINLAAAFEWKELGAPAHISSILSLIAGAYAAALAMAHNIESFRNYPERSQGFREAFELYVDTYREFEMLWQLHVQPEYDLPENCVNADELYRRLNQRHSEVRRKVKKLTSADGRVAKSGSK